MDNTLKPYKILKTLGNAQRNFMELFLEMIYWQQKFNKSEDILFEDKLTVNGEQYGRGQICWFSGLMCLSKNWITSKSGDKWSRANDSWTNNLTYPKFIDHRYFLMLWNRKLAVRKKCLLTSWKSNVPSKSKTVKFM